MLAVLVAGFDVDGHGVELSNGVLQLVFDDVGEFMGCVDNQGRVDRNRDLAAQPVAFPTDLDRGDRDDAGDVTGGMFHLIGDGGVDSVEEPNLAMAQPRRVRAIWCRRCPTFLGMRFCLP